MEINNPRTLAEVKMSLERYEDALVRNDVTALNELFWSNELTLRYGIAENLYGHDAIAGYRSARSPADLARETGRTVVTQLRA